MKKILLLICMFSTITLFSQKRGYSKSAKSGKFVSSGYANSHKSTTYTHKGKK